MSPLEASPPYVQQAGAVPDTSSEDLPALPPPVYGRWWELDTYLSAAASSKTSIDTSVTVDSGYGSTGMSPTIKPQGEVAKEPSSTATYDTHHAAEFPGVPPREFPKLPQEGLDTVRIAALGMAKARSKKRSPNAPFAPRPRKVSRKTALCLTERNGKLPQPLRKVLEEAEDEYIDLEDCICPLTSHYKLMEEAKAFYRLGEFDPSCLTADGGVRSGSIERSFLDDIPDELHELFIAYLRQLAMPRSYLVYNKKWKAAYRLERADAEFADNAFLATLLRYQDPFAPVPFGRNPMIDEYWRRRGHTYETLVREYFRINRAYAEKQDREWLRGADAMEIEYECFVGILDPSGEWLDLEIPELENLPVALVTEHPYKEDYAVVTRVYEEWEPLEQWGEERFPDCVEGDEARMCLDNYRSKMEFPPAYLEFCAKRELEEESW
ncbi:hypothetical protein FB567DRAFT_609077 [Paraphoma chrysanthemicola]|uniref:Uncharacterized protein n=1 Tax=Paraphoma chrysanthemicola TaxID=798071 RepID=A0A8K0W2Z0_9PLEO|nr:hypothetical protein FB567DRAFT_609077 [Paraphoma chrysanthemicola]